MTDSAAPTPPRRTAPAKSSPHFALYIAVKEAISTVPMYFRTETHIAGVMATDIQTLSGVLGAAIEEQVVRTLNLMRNVWDPKGQYAQYSFVRYPQSFPDVRLVRASGTETLVGIELKGWYLLAKEGEPSLRFSATLAACAEPDLIVVVPWALGNVISGSPTLFEPYIEYARFAAQYRNYYWQHLRQTKDDRHIMIPGNAHPYASKPDQIIDVPRVDGGGNFGRLARTGIMDEYMTKLHQTPLCGINAVYWREFLSIFGEGTTDEKARKALARMRKRIADATEPASERMQAALAVVTELERLLESTP